MHPRMQTRPASPGTWARLSRDTQITSVGTRLEQLDTSSYQESVTSVGVVHSQCTKAWLEPMCVCKINLTECMYMDEAVNLLSTCPTTSQDRTQWSQAQRCLFYLSQIFSRFTSQSAVVQKTRHNMSTWRGAQCYVHLNSQLLIQITQTIKQSDASKK